MQTAAHCVRLALAPVLLALMIAATLRTQSFETLPKIARTETPYEIDHTFFHAQPATVQYAYDVREIQAQQATFRSISWQAGRATTASNRSSLFGLQLTIATSFRTYDQLTPVFAANLGVDRTVVAKGGIVMPAISSGWTPALPFLRPFVFDKRKQAKSLIVQIEHYGSGSQRTWFMNRYSDAPGKITRAGAWPKCQASNGKVMSYGHHTSDPVAGRPMFMSFSQLPTATPSIAASLLMIGIKGPGSTAFGSIRLPVPLRNLGLPSPAGCELGLEPVIILAGAYVERSGQGHVEFKNLLFPDIPVFYGAKLYAQALVTDTDRTTKQIALITSVTLELRFGNGTRARGDRLFATGFGATIGSFIRSGTMRQRGIGAIRLGL